jgi:hypothetical protein
MIPADSSKREVYFLPNVSIAAELFLQLLRDRCRLYNNYVVVFKQGLEK